MRLAQVFFVILVLMSAAPAWAAGQIPFTINLSEAVTVTGTPRIRMDVGGATRYADYTSGSGTAALTFTYQMVSGDVDADGVQLFSPMELNGGTIKDTRGNDANLAFAVPNTSGVKVNAAVPSGYTVAIGTKDIISANQSAFAFDLTYNKTNRTYNYSISSSGGGTPVTGSGTTTGALQTVSGINVSSLPDGLLTLSVTLTDSLGGVGAATTDTGSKLTVANMALWLDAANTSSITSAAGAVSQWNDMSGNGYHATQGSGINKPITGTRTLNGRNTLDFDGTNHVMTGSASLYTVPMSDNTIFLVCKTDQINLLQRVWNGQAGVGSRWAIILTMGEYQAVNNTGWVPAIITTPLDLTGHIISMNRNGNTLTLRRDNLSAQQAAVNVTLDSLRIGRYSAGTDAFNGVVAEILVYTRSLSTSEMNTVGHYLSTKWGIAWTDIP